MNKIIFSDFDGTLTVNDHMGAVFFDILSLIEKSKSKLIIVSGRSLSWGHFLLTHFPLDVCVMEGGGVILRKDGRMLKSECTIDEDTVSKLEATCVDLQKLFPKAVLSDDSFGRLTDRALEYHLMDKSLLEEIEKFFDERDVNYSYSNVHLNFWCGEITKYKAVSEIMKSDGYSLDKSYYFGDALNDQSMFQYFQNTIGVSNIASVLDKMDHKPKTILKGSENHGALGVYSYLKDLF